MTFVFGGLLLVSILAGAVALVSILRDDYSHTSRLTIVSAAVGGVALLLLLILMCVALMFSGPNPLIEGTCYRAVRHTSTTFITVGKVLVPSTTSGIDLEVIRCPL